MIDPNKGPIGILGSGQLGQMFTQSAQSMGYQVHVFDKKTHDTPCGNITPFHTEASFQDELALKNFAQQVQAASYEFENIPFQTAQWIEQHTILRPSSKLLSIAQDRIQEKKFFSQASFPTTKYKELLREDQLQDIENTFSGKSVIKTSREGYDGKGQRVCHSGSEISSAWKELENVPCIVEEWQNFTAEISVVVARNPQGQTLCYGPFLNTHKNHILYTSQFPCNQPKEIISQALSISKDLAQNIDLQGVLCIEFFVCEKQKVLINEIAPRPHNSGHLTIEAFECSQFEQQVRTLCDLPLGSNQATVGSAVMINLLGELWEKPNPNFNQVLSIQGTHLHLYGKSEARKGRKMGHLTICDDSLERVQTKQKHIEDILFQS
ncbi:MAG: 5-(carboxyamino)imidazole ribonucleotide synthase [Bdellovibrionales bacterium]|nr:5-(carboxyamino)imidazole ribonucleotide synthase [Bdellovibrionales bacterium]